MQIVENKALVFRTRDPDKYSIIPRSKVVAENAGVYEMAVFWGLEEVRVLRNLGVKDLAICSNGRTYKNINKENV